ncbi:hypothetical protein ACOSP7_027018 [Xanthoceras sorbifolium]
MIGLSLILLLCHTLRIFSIFRFPLLWILVRCWMELVIDCLIIPADFLVEFLQLRRFGWPISRWLLLRRLVWYGFNASFYQKIWNIVGYRVSAACLGVLNNGHSMEEINITLIVLISKVERAVNVRDFCPISLCNVIYQFGGHLILAIGYFKLNIDASLSPAGGLVGLGLVVRNYDGLVVAAGAARVKAGLSHLLVESDAFSVVNVLRERSFPCSDLGLLIANIIQLVDVANIVSFSFIPRICNRVADAVGKHALALVFYAF